VRLNRRLHSIEEAFEQDGDNKPVAEKAEKRKLAKGNSVERNKGRAVNRATMQIEPTRIRQSMFTNNFARHYPRQEPSALAVYVTPSA